MRKEAGYGKRIQEVTAELARHFEQGRDYARAVAYLRQAGERALTRSACHEARAYFEQALSALSHLPETRETREQAIDLWLALRTALQPLGDLGRVLTCLRTAEALAVALDDSCRLARISLLLSRYFSLRGMYSQAITAAQHALNVTTASGDTVLQALANLNLGLAYLPQGDYRRVITCFAQTVLALDGARCREFFGQTILPAVNARAHLAWCHAELGTFAAGSVLVNEGLQIAEAVGHPGSLMVAFWGVGLLARRQGDLHRALPQLERAMSLCQEADLPMWFSAIAVELGAAYTLSGRVADAVPLLTRALAQTIEASGSQGNGSVSLGEVHLLAGRLEEAHTLTKRTLAFACEHQERGRQASALRLLGEIAAHRDPPEVESAQTYYRQALALAESLGMRPLQAHCHRGLGILYTEAGQAEQARVSLSAAITLYRAMDMTCWLPRAEAALAQVEG
jgi:tetratricopeptide (TPR) repeat protein